MPKQPKPKPVGRPKMAKGESKDAMLRVRATPEELRAFDRAAKANNQKRSDWIRNTLNAAITVEPRTTFQTKVMR